MVMSQNLEKNYEIFNEQKAQRIALIKKRESKFDLVSRMFIDDLLAMDALLDEAVEKLEDFMAYFRAFIPNLAMNDLIDTIRTARRNPEYLRQEAFPNYSAALYALKLKSLETLSGNINKLNACENKLRRIKQGPAQKDLPEVFDLLKKSIMPEDELDKTVIDFLLDDTAEIRDIFYQILKELQLFKALCALIESFPKELVEKMLEDAEESTPIQ